MYKASRVIAAAILAIGLFGRPAFAGDLNVGDLAPDFALKASDGRTYSLAELKGKTVVLAWFPKAFTAG